MNRGELARDGGAAVVLLVAVLALHPQLVVGTPWRFGADALEYAIPHATLLFRELAHGRFPLWNPFHDGGAPFLAQPPWMGPIYPAVALFALPPGRALDVGFLVHLASFAVGAYVLARTRGIGRVASGLGALAVGAGTPLADLARLGYLPEAVAASYLPWVLVSLDRGIRGVVSSRRAVLGAGVCLGLMHLGGHLVASGAVLFGAFFYVLALGATEAGWRGVRRAVGLLAAAEVVGMALAAVQIVPLVTAGLASSLSGGRDISAEYAYLTEAWRLGNFLFADLGPTGKGHLFVGVTLLPFVALAGRRWGTAFRPNHDPWGMVLGCLVLSLGDATPLWRCLRAIAPPLRIFSYFYFFLIPAALGVALLAAHGLDAWLTSGPERAASRRLRLAAGVLAALALATFESVPGDLYVDGSRVATSIQGSLPWSLAALAVVTLATARPRAAVLAVSLALVVELGHFATLGGVDRSGAFDARRYFDRADLADALPPPGAGRVLGVERTRGAQDWALRRNGGLMLGYEDVGLDSKLPLERVAMLTSQLGSAELDWTTRLASSKEASRRVAEPLELAPESRDTRILDVLGVTTIVADVPLTGGAFRGPLREVIGEDAERAGIDVWERAPREPRARLFTSWRGASSTAQALRELLEGSASPFDSPVVERLDESASAPSRPGAPSCPLPRRIWRAGAVELETACGTPSLLVSGEIAASGWRATVDGVPTPTSVANVVMVAIRLPAGAHRVAIRYLPREVLAGVVVSLASWLGLAAAAFVRRRVSQAPPS